jgi:hypothetical protein
MMQEVNRMLMGRPPAGRTRKGSNHREEEISRETNNTLMCWLEEAVLAATHRMPLQVELEANEEDK